VVGDKYLVGDLRGPGMLLGGNSGSVMNSKRGMW